MSNIFFNRPLPTSGFYSYTSAIKNADLILGMGGGYLTTKAKYTDYFGLLLTLLPIYIAKLFNKKIIMLPMSFGPFASSTQKKITYNAIKNTTVIARDYITLKELEKIDKESKINRYYSPDLALFHSKNKLPDLNVKLNSKYIVLTAREWFSNKDKQISYEHALTKLVDTIWGSYGLQTIFIPMAKNVIEDDDNRVVERIIDNIKDKKSIKVINPKNIPDLQKILANARLAVCTRMHSAILATTVNTPFIAIGYGQKTLGFVENFNIEEWYVDINDVDYVILLHKFKKLLIKKHYVDFIKTVNKKNNIIKFYKQKIINEIRV